jgi:hypothetical protein
MPTRLIETTDVDDDGKLRMRFHNAKSNAKKSGIRFLLTFDQYVDQIKRAGLTSSRISRSHQERYVLVRVSDRGPYARGNCRFVTMSERNRNRWPSVKTKLANRRSFRKASEAFLRLSPDERKQRCVYNLRHHLTAKRLIGAVIKDQKRSKLDQRYTGENNGQYGSFWLTDGVTNRKWRLEYGDIPEGFRRGRIQIRKITHVLS